MSDHDVFEVLDKENIEYYRAVKAVIVCRFDEIKDRRVRLGEVDEDVDVRWREKGDRVSVIKIKIGTERVSFYPTTGGVQWNTFQAAGVCQPKEVDIKLGVQDDE